MFTSPLGRCVTKNTFGRRRLIDVAKKKQNKKNSIYLMIYITPCTDVLCQVYLVFMVHKNKLYLEIWDIKKSEIRMRRSR